MKRLLALLLCWPLLLGAASRAFDDADDEIDMGNTINTSTGSNTNCVWFKGTEDAGSDHLLGKKANHTATTDGYVIRQNTTDNLACLIGDGAAGITSSHTGGDADGAWNWACCGWDGSGDTTTFYVNGTLVDSDTATMGNISSTSALQFGEDASDGNDANGLIAYGIIYGSSVLTVNEVNEIMWQPEILPINAAADNISFLAPLWGASTEQDLSGNGRVGTVSGTGATSEDGPPVMFGMALPL